jgi:anthranilate synthase component 2
MHILLLNNYDSFTYNLLHLIELFDGMKVEVVRNDQMIVQDAEKYDRIIISPGPGLPSEAGITKDLIRKYYSSKPMLGVCLGMQAMAEACGGKIYNLTRVFHGVAEPTIIIDTNEKLFAGIPSPFRTGRYHSWAVQKENLPSCLHVTAIDKDGDIMSFSHENQLMRGVQFHPESILTDFGKELMSNWLFHC